MPKGLPGIGAKRERGLLLLGAGGLHNWNQLPSYERESDKHGREDHAGHGEDNLEIVRLKPGAKESPAAEKLARAVALRVD